MKKKFWLVLSSLLLALVSGVLAVSAQVPSTPQTGTTTRISVASDGTEGDFDSAGWSISADGRYVAFSSLASNLVGGDSRMTYDIFLHDQETGETTMIPHPGGYGEWYGSLHPDISADGRYIAFQADIASAVRLDCHVFVYDRITGEITLVSGAPDGSPSNMAAVEPDISADGRFVLFESSASNLVPGDTNNARDVFVHDRVAQETTRVSIAADGTEGNGDSMEGVISADGQYVAFASNATTLIPEDTNGTWDVFVHARSSGTLLRISRGPDGTESNSFSGSPAISENGRYVTFTSAADNLVNGDTVATCDTNWDLVYADNCPDIFVHDLETGATRRISVAADGSGGNQASRESAISADGRFVAFSSTASNLVRGDTNGVSDAFIRDLATGETTRVSLSDAGTQASLGSSGVFISASGQHVGFSSSASELVAGDTNQVLDAFVHDRGLTNSSHLSFQLYLPVAR